MQQIVISATSNYSPLNRWILQNNCKNILLIADNSWQYQKKLATYMKGIENNGTKIVIYSDFESNPIYESVVKGVHLFNQTNCDAIMAVGGGSAIDVAKCIKLYSNMDHSKNYLFQEIKPNNIPFLAIPTTAGTGSEATRYAVIYYQGEKQSITSDSCIPQTVLLDSNSLYSLPQYQRKVTMMDAFCHAIESFWSINSTEQSRQYSQQAMNEILQNMDGYLNNNPQSNEGMLLAAHKAGKAINITQTTAGHAMCYKITSLFGIAHGHAAILCNRVLFPWMCQNTHLCIDSRGEDFLKDILQKIAQNMGCNTYKDATDKIQNLFIGLELSIPKCSEEQLKILVDSVNPIRLKNFPIKLDKNTIENLYKQIVRI